MSLSFFIGSAVSSGMPVFKPILAFVFAAMIIATSGAMASARGMARDATGEMVLCVGTGSVTVLMGADGQPLGVAHFCPDCALGSLAAVAENQTVQMPAAMISKITFVPYTTAPTPFVGIGSSARDPPFI
jgi:hypothetical protein